MVFCSTCGGGMEPLGALGYLDYYRCRHCGMGSAFDRQHLKDELGDDYVDIGFERDVEMYVDDSLLED